MLASTPTSLALGALLLIAIVVSSQLNIVRRTIINKRNRKAHDPSQLGKPNVLTAADEAGVNTVTVDIELSGPFSLKGIPQIQSSGANAGLPTSASKQPGNVLRLVYALTQAAATGFTIPDRDPAVRTLNGGYLVARTFFIAE